MDKNMMEKIKLLKRELFMDGFDTIENFIGYKLNEDEDDDVIERRVDIAIDSMSEDELNIWFEKYDIILAPAAPTTAPLLGSSLQDPIKMYLSDIYTISANLAGIPGLSIPCGKDNKGLPIGMQLLGGCFQEKTLLRAGFAYEKAREEEA